MKKTLLLPLCLVAMAITLEAQVKETPLPPPPPPPPPKVVVTTWTPPVITIEDAAEFYKKNPSVARISRRADIITLEMKDKTKEKYDMSSKEEKKSFTDKYGRSPIPPPPPPPKKP